MMSFTNEHLQWHSKYVKCVTCFLMSLYPNKRKRQLNCLQAAIPGSRHATMFLADDNCPAVPERTKHSCKRSIIVYVWLNNGSTTPAAQALVVRKINRGRQALRRH